MSKIDVLDALGPSLQKFASKDDVLALLKHNMAQKDQITDFRDEARMIDGANSRKVTSFHKTVMSKIDILQKDVGSLTEKVAAKDDVSALCGHMTSRKEREALHESIKILNDQVAGIHGMIGGSKDQCEENMVSLRQDLHEIQNTVSTITSYDTLQVAGIEGEIASLHYALSVRRQQAEQLSVIPPKQYASLKEDIVAAVEENSARQKSLLREEILDAVRSLGISDTSEGTSNKGLKDTIARRSLKVPSCTIK